MDREIKFRAWNPISCAMFWSARCKNLAFFFEHIGHIDLAEGFALMQYTGLKDKNGKGNDTYHKDILKVHDGFSGDHFEKGGNYVIEWFDDGWGVADKDGDYFCSLFEVIYNRGAEVIGNIYENPELLEVNNARKR